MPTVTPPAPPGTPARAAQMRRSIATGNGWTKRIVRRPVLPTLATFLGQDDVTVSTAPPAVEEQVVYETTLPTSVLASNGLSVEDLVVEHAHRVYATGVGNVLGTYTASTANNLLTLRYEWMAANAPAGLTPTALSNALRQTADDLTVGGYAVNATLNPVWQQGTQTFADLNFGPLYGGVVPYVPPTPEQQAAWQAQEAKLQVVAQRAERLLLAHLTAVQRATWLAEHYVDVVAPSGRRYRLRGGHGNDERLAADGTPERRYCVYGRDPRGSLPVADQVFVKLLALRYDERSLLAAANTWDLRRGGVFVGQGADADLPALEVAA